MAKKKKPTKAKKGAAKAKAKKPAKKVAAKATAKAKAKAKKPAKKKSPAKRAPVVAAPPPLPPMDDQEPDTASAPAADTDLGEPPPQDTTQTDQGWDSSEAAS
jgi:hypothetical protein